MIGRRKRTSVTPTDKPRESRILPYAEIEGGFRGDPDIEFDTNAHAVNGVEPTKVAVKNADEAVKARFNGTLAEATEADSPEDALDELEKQVEETLGVDIYAAN